MKARTSLILAASALAAVFVLSFLMRLDSGASTSSTDSDASASRVASGNASEPETPAHDSSARRALASIDDEPATLAGDLFEVDVMHASTNAPVADAIVWWWPVSSASPDENTFQEWLRRNELEQHLESAVQLRADRAGRVRLANAEQGGFIVATAGDLWGSTFLAPAGDVPRSVLVAPNVDLNVLVVDERGEPVGGALVALRERRLDACFEHMTARTGASDGKAVLRHASRIFGAQPELNAHFQVALQGLFDPLPEQAIDAGATLGELVTLVLAQSGSCEIVVVDANDQAVDGPLDARLRFADSQGPSEFVISRTGEGVVFERVELGRELVVEVTREASGGVVHEARGTGPRHAGERVQLRVPVDAGIAILRGRVVDATGATAGDVSARAFIESEKSGRNFEKTWPVRTRSDGRFTIELPPYTDGEPRTFALARLSSDGSEIAVARRELPRELRAGSHDLGELAFVEMPIVAAGHVIDSDGRPIVGAIVEAAPCAASVGEEQDEPLNSVLAVGRSDKHGSFEIRGQTTCGELVLEAHGDDWIGNSVSVRAGARNVELVLEAAASLEGVVLLDPSLHSGVILVQAAPEDSAKVHAPATAVTVGRDGHFVLRGLASGAYTLKVVFAATAGELANVPGVRAAAGNARRDPRLDPLDLRETHRLIELEIADEHGDPVSGARAFSRASDDGDARWSYSGREGGRLELLSDGRPLDVAISAPGFLRSELERVTTSQRVVMRRAAHVRLRLARPALVPEPPLRLSALLTPCDVGRFCGFADSVAVEFDARGELVCETSFVGAMRVELMLARRGLGAPAAAYIEDASPRVIYVESHAGEQVFEIEIDAARLARAHELVGAGD